VKRLEAAALLLGLWSIPGVMYSLEAAHSWAMEGAAAPLWRAALYQIPSWWVWAVATHPLIRLTRAFPVSRRGPLRSIAVHAAGCLGVGCCYVAVKSTMALWVLPGGVRGAFLDRVLCQLAEWLPATALTYAAVIGVTTAMLHARTAQQRALRTAQLEAELARTQLEALRAQIHPHFVFNALHTVAAIIRVRDPDRAVTVIASLADILRDTFRGAPDREVELREELAWIARYLSIQQARFGDRIEVVWRIGDGTLDALVPRMVLQPLIENAFHHGMARRGTPGRVELSAERDDKVLTLCVRDDGPPFQDARAASAHSRTGLASARARLALLYADAAQLTLGRGADAWTVATVRLPFHRSARGMPGTGGATTSDG
jgi:anti-sigma regulatory factor (Ser/Thr protein kinase)